MAGPAGGSPTSQLLRCDAAVPASPSERRALNESGMRGLPWWLRDPHELDARPYRSSHAAHTAANATTMPFQKPFSQMASYTSCSVARVSWCQPRGRTATSCHRTRDGNPPAISRPPDPNQRRSQRSSRLIGRRTPFQPQPIHRQPHWPRLGGTGRDGQRDDFPSSVNVSGWRSVRASTICGSVWYGRGPRG
jgi:hypothetical protein